MNFSLLPLPGLSSVSGKPVVVKFDARPLSSDGGVLALRDIEGRLRVSDRLARSWLTRARPIRSPTASPTSSGFGC